MARRALPNETWWLQATAMLQDERETTKHYTPDLGLIMRQIRVASTGVV